MITRSISLIVQNSDIKQGTDAWFAVRCGKVTASRIHDLTAKTRTKYGSSRTNYMAQLICERLTGAVAEGYTNAAMQFGIENEAQARFAYQLFSENKVKETGFIDHPVIPEAGCSPDGIIDENGLVEIKVPNTATHLDFLLGDPIAEKYIKQVQFQMACTGRQWCDFVSFDPRLPLELQLKVQRVERDDAIIAVLEDEICVFLRELENKINALEALQERFKIPDTQISELTLKTAV